MHAKRRLRAEMRARRSALSTAYRHCAALGLYRSFRRHPLFLRAASIAGYFPMGGELDPGPLLAHAHHLGKAVYLPVLNGQSLRFARYHPGRSALRCNRYGIPEPRTPLHGCVDARALDLILMPLVAFDARGGRLGMGGGYYDRTLAFKRRRHAASRPLLVGLGYDCQETACVPTEPWDVPLTGVVTERRRLLARHAGRA